MFHIWKYYTESMQTYYNPNRIKEHAAFASGLWTSDWGPDCFSWRSRERDMQATPRPFDKAIQLLQRQSGSTKSKVKRRHTRGSKSTELHQEVDEKEEHQPTSKTSPSSMHYPWAVVHSYTLQSPSVNYFPGGRQKNSLSGSSSTFSKKTFDDVKGCCSCLEETCHRPPREETERLQKEGERRREDSLQ